MGFQRSPDLHSNTWVSLWYVARATVLNTSILDLDNTVRILLATDNHIGYLERDPIRGQDSIDTFKEILQLAVKHDVRLFLALCTPPQKYSYRSTLSSLPAIYSMRTDRREIVYTRLLPS